MKDIIEKLIDNIFSEGFAVFFFLVCIFIILPVLVLLLK